VNSIGDQGPPNYCLHRVARMLRPALTTDSLLVCQVKARYAPFAVVGPSVVRPVVKLVISQKLSKIDIYTATQKHVTTSMIS